MCPADGAPPCPFGEVLAGSQPGQWHQDVLRALEDNRCHGVGWGEHGPRGKCGGSVGGPGSHAGIVPASVSGGIGTRAKHGAVGRGAAGTAAIAEGNGGVLRPCPLSNRPPSHLKALCMGQILGQRYAAPTW